MYQSTALEMAPGTLFQFVVKEISRKWRELPKEGKKKYENAFLIDREQRAADKMVGGGVDRT